MSVTVSGEVQFIEMGTGTWAIATPEQTYELYGDPPAALLQQGQKVSVTGRIRDDVMTLAMIGPVLEVASFEVLPS